MTPPTDDGSSLVERVKGKAKGLAGAALGDSNLEREGQLHEQKADALDDADRLEGQAEQAQTDADLAARTHEIEVERRRLADEEAEARRTDELAQKREQDEARIEAQADRREQAVEAQADATEKAAAREQLEATRERSEELDAAGSLTDEAERARAQADALDRAADAAEER